MAVGVRTSLARWPLLLVSALCLGQAVSTGIVFAGAPGPAVSQPGGPAADLEVDAKSLTRSDLPDDFPFQVFDAGYAVLRIRVSNRGTVPLSLDPTLFGIHGPKGKRIDQAPPSEIPPKILKHYRSGGSAIHGGGYYGYPGNYPGAYPPGTVPRETVPGSSPTGRPTTSGPRQLDAGTGTMLREKFESFQFKAAELAPGETTEGFVYLRSKDSGNRLAGGYVVINGRKFPY